MRPKAAGLVLVSALALLTGCAATSKPASPSPHATTAQPVVLDDLFQVEPGRKLHLSCVGTGTVTVLLEAGGGSGSNTWPGALTQPLEEQTRVCSYDRAGTGGSDPAPDRRRLLVDVTRDLDALLSAAGIQGRLLLVGTSFGGEAALSWALLHPTRTAGLVILDTDWPTGDVNRTPARFTPAAQRAQERAMDVWNAPDNVEHIDYQATGAKTEAAFRTLPGIPIRILTAMQSAECDSSTVACHARNAALADLQKQWLRLSPSAVQVRVDAGHDLPQEATDTVVREITTALSAAR